MTCFMQQTKSVQSKEVKTQVIERLNGYYGDAANTFIVLDHINEYNDKHYLYVYPNAYGDRLGLADLDKYSYLIVCEGLVIKDVVELFGVNSQL